MCNSSLYLLILSFNKISGGSGGRGELQGSGVVELFGSGGSKRSGGGGDDLNNLVSSLLASGEHVPNESNIPFVEVVYYISCWMICATKKEGRLRRGGQLGHWLIQFASNAKSVDPDSARGKNLPTGKVARIYAYGGLKYPSIKCY